MLKKKKRKRKRKNFYCPSRSKNKLRDSHSIYYQSNALRHNEDAAFINEDEQDGQSAKKRIQMEKGKRKHELPNYEKN